MRKRKKRGRCVVLLISLGGCSPREISWSKRRLMSDKTNFRVGKFLVEFQDLLVTDSEIPLRMSSKVFAIQGLRIPGWRDTWYHGTSLLKTGVVSGFPVLLIWMHNPPLHLSHPALRHGANAGLQDPLLSQYTIDVFCVQYDSIMLVLPGTFKSVTVRAG